MGSVNVFLRRQRQKVQSSHCIALSSLHRIESVVTDQYFIAGGAASVGILQLIRE